jgi:serine/threonine protein kinase
MTIAFTPDFLDRYKIEGPLGEGGMGTVYRGEQRSLERPVAIKFLSRQLLDDEYLARFRTEAKAAAQIFHSNLVAVIETGTMEDLPYIVFELVAGTSLRAYLTDRGGTLPVQQALDFVRQAADGLACAHKAGIVHRDIKPENLLVTPDGSIKVADFGVAKAQVSPGQKTRTGLIMGTPAYLSPEQAHEKPVTPASDVWALGVVLHELIAGAQPFTRATTLELLTAIVSDPPPPLPASVPAPVAELAGRMLAKDPAQRIASMQEVSRACARLAPDRRHHRRRGGLRRPHRGGQPRNSTRPGR